MKRALVVMIMFTMFVGSVFVGIPTSAETQEDLESIQKQRVGIKENLSEAENEITDILVEIEAYNSEINRLEEELRENEELVKKTEESIESTISEVKRLGEEIEALENAIAERYDILKNRAVAYQQSGGSISYLEVIFGSKDFGDFISRMTAVNKIADADANLMKQQESDMQKVQENQTAVVANLDELNAMKTKLDDTSALIKEQKGKNTQQKAALNNKQEELTARINELELEDSKLASLEAEIEAEKQKEEKNELVLLSKVEENPSASTVKKTESNVDESTKKKSSESKTFSVTSTAYTVQSAGGSGYTSTGINLKKNPNAKVIAVDPSVIPLGSVVFVEGYGYAVAGDIGSAIKGNKIDVFVPTQKAAVNWGVRTVKVTIVE